MDLSILNIDPVAAILLTGFVIGFVELAKNLYDKKWREALIIAVAGLAGGVVSPFLGIDLITGIVGGLASSGAITLAQNLGGVVVDNSTTNIKEVKEKK